jgi:hypothetical protein
MLLGTWHHMYRCSRNGRKPCLATAPSYCGTLQPGLHVLLKHADGLQQMLMKTLRQVLLISRSLLTFETIFTDVWLLGLAPAAAVVEFRTPGTAPAACHALPAAPARPVQMQQPLPVHCQDSSSAQVSGVSTARRALQLQHRQDLYRLLLVDLPLLGLWESRAGGWLLPCWRDSGLHTTTHTAAAQWLLLQQLPQVSHQQQQQEQQAPGPAAGICSSHARGRC